MPSLNVHRSITEAAIAKLGVELQKEFSSGLLEGVADPDKVPDRELKPRVTARGRVRTYVGYAKHHGPSRNLVEYYFNLSLYHLRRGDGFKAGFMLGRALHYVQDGALSRRRYFVLDVHDREEEVMKELAKSPQHVEETCRTVNVSGKRGSSRAAEALCIALRESVDLLTRFTKESNKPVDVSELKRRVRRIRLAKALIASASALLTAVSPSLTALTLPIICITLLFRPKTYYEAMRAGLMLLRPIGVKPAY
ncbi:MAG: hypothetical protein QW230_03030 [Thermofilum sp.]